MTFLFAGLLLTIAFLAYKWSGSLLFPPVFFSSLWGGILLWLGLSGDAFYPLSVTVLSLCSMSVLCFTFGSCLVLHSRSLFRTQKQRRTPQVPSLLRFLDLCLFGAIVAFPFYVQRINSFTQVAPDSNILRNARTEAVLGDRAQTGYGWFDYLMPIALVMSLIAIAEACRTGASRWRAAAWTSITLAYYILTGSRLDSMILLIAASCIILITRPRLKKLIILGAICGILSIFAIASIALRYGPEADVEASSWDSVSAVAKSFRLYALGGIVACDQRLQNDLDPEPGVPHSLWFVYAVGRKLGWTDVSWDFIEPQITTPQITNVYSVYYYYFRDFGWIGTGLIFIGLGVLFAWLYKKMVQGHPESLILYCLGCGFLVFTNANDPFLIGLAACIKGALAVILVYQIPRIFARKTMARAFIQHRPRELA